MLKRLYSWYGKRTVLIVLGSIGVLFLAALFLSDRDSEQIPSENREITSVEVQSVRELAASEPIELIGTVEAVNEAQLLAESGGRVIRVQKKLGDSVSAGEVIIAFENAAEQAAVLQAEGAYEAALAAARQSESSSESAQTALTAAQNDAVVDIRSSFISSESIVHNSIDPLFSNPQGPVTGFRLDSQVPATQLVNARAKVGALLQEWSLLSRETIDEDELDQVLARSLEIASQIAAFTDAITQAAASDKNDGEVIGGLTIEAIRANLSEARSLMNGVIGTLSTAQTNIAEANELLLRAKIGSTEVEVSSASAQIKQALGNLRAAQALLETTIIRAPFSGTINVLGAKLGETIAPGTPVVRIANNAALEVTAFVGASERDRIEVGMPVLLGDAEGTVTKIAPAIDPMTGKIEVKIGTSERLEDLKNGDTVSVELLADPGEASAITLPLGSIKLTPDGPVVFTVEEGVLVPIQIILGEILGERAIVEAGLGPETEIVVDARGLNSGDTVTVAQ